MKFNAWGFSEDDVPATFTSGPIRFIYERRVHENHDRPPFFPDFYQVFEQYPQPGVLIAMTQDYPIVAVNQRYLAFTHTQREDLLGHTLSEVFPENPQDLDLTSASDLRHSIERVRHQRASDLMKLKKYSVRHPAINDDLEPPYCCPVNTPIYARELPAS